MRGRSPSWLTAPCGWASPPRTIEKIVYAGIGGGGSRSYLPCHDVTETAVVIGVVDDDESVRVAVDALLRSASYRCTGFASAEEFLSSPNAASVCCLILDWRLPSGMD